MTRSGCLTQFTLLAQSPIGPIFLAFLAVTIVFSVILLSLRMHLLEDEGKIAALMSREAAFLLNNVVFVVFTFTVLLGTVFPLVTEAIKGVKISVGEPYFDQMAAPIGLVSGILDGNRSYPSVGTSRYETSQGSHDPTGHRRNCRRHSRRIPRT